MEERTHRGPENVIDDRPRATEEPSHAPDAADRNPSPGEIPVADSRRGTRLVLGAGSAAFAVTLSLLIAGSRPSTNAQAVNAAQTTAVRARPSDSPATPERTPVPTWAGRRQPGWATDGTKTVTFALLASNDVPLSKGARPQLVARCLSGAIDVYVVTGPLGVEGDDSNHTVHVRVDEGPEEVQRWSDSESGQELFSPDGSALATRLAHAHRLRLGFTPFGAMPVTADFAVDGFDELAPVLVRTCARPASRSVALQSHN